MSDIDKKLIGDVWSFYGSHGRSLPWRELSVDSSTRLYQVLVSEMMLQQTQVTRVVTKYLDWMAAFPSMSSLADAPLEAVLKKWSGLGYNRRAKYLHDAAKAIYSSPDVELESLKGIGRNTAAAISVYADNHPKVFIETNIRTVFLHYYFTGVASVSDKELAVHVDRTMDIVNPREWYWALMDYGTSLKKSVNNINQSSGYKKQSRFEGSRRQLRGRVLKILSDRQQTYDELALLCPELSPEVMVDLQKDGLVHKTTDGHYRLGADE